MAAHGELVAACAPQKRSARSVLSDVEREVETTRREAEVEVREEAVRLRAEIEREVQDRRVEIAKVEERVVRLEADIEEKLGELDRREQGAPTVRRI